jgi:hypothetical protein
VMEKRKERERVKKREREKGELNLQGNEYK